MNSEINGNCNGHYYKIHSINTSPPFIIFFHTTLKILTHTFKMTKIFLLCITLLVVILFFISFTHIEELGKDFIGLIIISVLPLLGLACVVTFCFGRDLD